MAFKQKFNRLSTYAKTSNGPLDPTPKAPSSKTSDKIYSVNLGHFSGLKAWCRAALALILWIILVLLFFFSLFCTASYITPEAYALRGCSYVN